MIVSYLADTHCCDGLGTRLIVRGQCSKTLYIKWANDTMLEYLRRACSAQSDYSTLYTANTQPRYLRYHLRRECELSVISRPQQSCSTGVCMTTMLGVRMTID